MISIPIWVFVIICIALMPWLLVFLGIITHIIGAIIDIHRENKQEKEKTNCPDYMEGPDENI